MTMTRLDDWTLTAHAREQMVTRRITASELDSVLAAPERTIPDPKGRDGCRYYVRGNHLAVVHEPDRVVITVGHNGASSSDWQQYVPDGDYVYSADPETPSVVRTATRRKAPRTLVADSTTLQVDDDLWATAVAMVDSQDGRRGRIEILGPDLVVIHNNTSWRRRRKAS